jgi:uncharacterized membrane protein YczE
MKEILEGFFNKDHFFKRLVTVVIAVIMMGFFLSWLLLVDLGTDPCTFMNNSISAKIGMTLGSWQALLNVILLIFVVIFGGRNLGFGTIANMFLVGYSIDFFSWVWGNILPDGLFEAWIVRIAVLIPSLILFVLSAAIYMNMDMGTAPYDAIPYIISSHLPKVPFRIVRIIFDLTVTVVGIIFGGKLGIVTVLMVFSIGPVVEWVAQLLKTKIQNPHNLQP